MSGKASMSINGAYNFRPLNELISSSGSVTRQQIESLSSDGYQAVINLLPDDNDYALKDEKLLIEAQGLNYVHIPVDFKSPTDADFDEFSKAMGLFTNKQLHIHCAANWRVSAFYAIYQVKNGNWSADQAWQHIEDIWSPDEHPVWAEFINKYLG